MSASSCLCVLGGLCTRWRDWPDTTTSYQHSSSSSSSSSDKAFTLVAHLDHSFGTIQKFFSHFLNISILLTPLRRRNETFEMSVSIHVHTQHSNYIRRSMRSSQVLFFSTRQPFQQRLLWRTFCFRESWFIGHHFAKTVIIFTFIWEVGRNDLGFDAKFPRVHIHTYITTSATYACTHICPYRRNLLRGYVFK